MRRVVIRGWPTMAMLFVGEGERRERDAECRMCVCGIETVIIMRRGGYGDGGAEAGRGISGKGAFGRRIVLWVYDVMSVCQLHVLSFCSKSHLMPFLQPSLRVMAYDVR